MGKISIGLLYAVHKEQSEKPENTGGGICSYANVSVVSKGVFLITFWSCQELFLAILWTVDTDILPLFHQW